ncbi:hypothetical protein TcasGA2_TC006674 [Tribolium castaneum]|uniref:DUF4485 domain-containing protein n=1 Tax=Tribolium castaneum TaxID=7070 RepID=D6WYE5_TRICA|nr:PREDICTED: uncharacterized protein LOC103314109 [Tribolium castaneum]EFA08967.1 hypothetical protein TcasGA2_TC006674 [Tribolium castaneum]|eukprot:XP_008197322.1 PREDICTED: uncharacterized protein LOC103314109 [Tribolium castaneum]
MATSAVRKILDVYDEEFATNMEIAKNLVGMVQSPKDKEICKKWILKLRQLKATDTTVKKNRNSFFKYFLQVLHKAVQGEDYLGPSPLDTKADESRGRDFMCRWSSDKRTYVAAKPLPGEGTLVYMAVSKDPSLGWEKQGETIYV